MNIFTVTFCGMDPEAESNPLWHTCLLLSSYDEQIKKMEVVENFGFGGVPATSRYSFIRKLKANFGLDTDFYGNHGMLAAEETRRLEKGCGLHGVTFELSEENFKLLQKKCHQMISDQNEAIDDAARDLDLKPCGLPVKIRHYPLEHESSRIYQHELKKAQEENRKPRLHEFSLNMSSQANTCKAQVLSLLDGVITPEQLKRVTGWHPAVTKMSGPMENIYLHSTGPLSEHKKSSGEVIYFRKNKDAKLYWTFPPQEFEALSGETRHFFKVYDDQCDTAKKVVRQLQMLEWFFRRAALADTYSAYRHELLRQIVSLYEAFAIIEPKKSLFEKNDWMSFWTQLVSQPRDEDEKILLKKIENAKSFIQSIYFAAVDNWELDNTIKKSVFRDNESLLLLGKDECIEALASYLSEKQKKELCNIIGRYYVSESDNVKSLADDESLAFAVNMLNG